MRPFMTLGKIFSVLIFRRSVVSTRAVLILTRLIVGYGFLQHGYAKVGNGAEHFAASFAGLGLREARIMRRVTLGAGLISLLLSLSAVVFLAAIFFLHCPFACFRTSCRP